MKKILSLLLITMLIIGHSSIVFADADSIDNYYQLEYIQSSGNGTGTGQYIDTGVTLDGTSYSYDLKFQIMSTQSGQRHVMSTYGGKYRVQIGWNGNVFMNTGNNGTYTPNTVSTGVDYIFQSTASAGNYASAGSGYRNLYLFAQNEGSAYWNSSIRLYYAKIMDSNNELVRSFVPVERKSDNVLGLYDLVNNQFYTNQGYGSFTGGNRIMYTLTTAVSPDNSGTVSGAGSYYPGTNVTITATPDTGYIFSSWQDGNTDNPRTIKVIEDATYTATFSPVQSTYTVSVSANPNGSGSVTGGGNYASGSTVVLTASPNTGYEFINWNDGSVQNPRTITVTDNVTLVANFQLVPEDKILISTGVNPSGSGYVTGGGYYDENDEITLEAHANSGYVFVDWSDGNDDNPRDITVTDELTLIANFELINPPEPVDQDSMTLVMLLVSFLILVMLERGTVFNG